MLKSIFCLSICLCAITLPSLAELTPQDFKEIRSIVKEEIETVLDKELAPIKADIKSMKADIVTLKEGFARLDERLTGVEKQIAMVANLVLL